MSSFDTFISQAWRDHAENSDAVAARLPEALSLLEKPEQVAPLARLIVHVEGEHLGRWQEGLELLSRVKESPHSSGPEAEAALRRGSATLTACERGSLPAEGLSASDKARCLAAAAAALSARGQGERAEAFFRSALQAAAKLPKDDPAQRDLAVTSNNMASILEEKADRAFRDTELMLMAAHAARRHWELAGTWLEVERAEYRLALSFLAAKKPGDARRHAELCLEIAAANNAGPLELFFGQEALALSFHASGDSQGFTNARGRARDLFARLPAEEKPWCLPSLEKLEALA